LRPGESAVVTVPSRMLSGLPADGELWLVLDVVTDTETAWGPRGAVVCHAQAVLREDARDLSSRCGLRVQDAGDESSRPPEVDGHGVLRHRLLTAGPTLSLWRAPTDNDRIGGMAARWEASGLSRLERSLVSIDHDGETVVVRSVHRGTDAEAQHTQQLTTVLLADGSPAVLVEEDVEIPPAWDDLPRVGTTVETVPGIERVRWLGGGPGESYPDRCAVARIGWYETVADAWFTPYLRPQESGGRHGVHRLHLDGAPGRLVVRPDRPAQVSVTRYRATDLAEARHHDELVARPGLVVHLDAAHRGLGTASCGPDTLEQYLVRPGRYRWSYLLG